MAATKKNIARFIGMALLGLIIGTLFWEAVERLFQAMGLDVSLTIANPLVLDLHALSVSIRPNIGSAAGFLGGILLFFAF